MVCNLLDCGSRKHVLPMGAPMVDLTLAEPFLALGSRAEEVNAEMVDSLGGVGWRMRSMEYNG